MTAKIYDLQRYREQNSKTQTPVTEPCAKCKRSLVIPGPHVAEFGNDSVWCDMRCWIASRELS